jgi:predicted ArsR family transcriptional regulator
VATSIAHTAPTQPAPVEAQRERFVVTPADRQVLHELADEPLSLAEIASRLGITTNAARARLGRLRSRGEVNIIGGQGQPGSTYELSAKVNEAAPLCTLGTRSCGAAKFGSETGPGQLLMRQALMMSSAV